MNCSIPTYYIDALHSTLDKYSMNEIKEKKLKNKAIYDRKDVKKAMWSQEHLSKVGSRQEKQISYLRNKLLRSSQSHKNAIKLLNSAFELSSEVNSSPAMSAVFRSLKTRIENLEQDQSLLIGLGNDCILHAMMLRIERNDSSYNVYFTNTGLGLNTNSKVHPSICMNSRHLKYQVTALYRDISLTKFSTDFFKKLVQIQAEEPSQQGNLSDKDYQTIRKIEQSESLKQYYLLLNEFGDPEKTSVLTHQKLWGYSQEGDSCTARSIIYQLKSALSSEEFKRVKIDLVFRTFIEHFKEYMDCSKPSKSKQLLLVDSLEKVIRKVGKVESTKSLDILKYKLQILLDQFYEKVDSSNCYIEKSKVSRKARKVQALPSAAKKKSKNRFISSGSKEKKSLKKTRRKGRQIFNLCYATTKRRKDRNTKRLYIESVDGLSVEYTGINLFFYQLYLAAVQHQDDRVEALLNKDKYMRPLFTNFLDNDNNNSSIFKDLDDDVFDLFCSIPYLILDIKTRSNYASAYAFALLAFCLVQHKGHVKDIEDAKERLKIFYEKYHTMRIPNYIDDANHWRGRVFSRLEHLTDALKMS